MQYIQLPRRLNIMKRRGNHFRDINQFISYSQISTWVSRNVQALFLEPAVTQSLQWPNYGLHHRHIVVWFLELAKDILFSQAFTLAPRPARSRSQWVQGKVHSRRGHEGPEGEQMYSSTLPSTSALDGGGWSTPRPGHFTPGKEPIPIA